MIFFHTTFSFSVFVLFFCSTNETHFIFFLWKSELDDVTSWDGCVQYLLCLPGCQLPPLPWVDIPAGWPSCGRTAGLHDRASVEKCDFIDCKHRKYNNVNCVADGVLLWLGLFVPLLIWPWQSQMNLVAEWAPQAEIHNTSVQWSRFRSISRSDFFRGYF